MNEIRTNPRYLARSRFDVLSVIRCEPVARQRRSAVPQSYMDNGPARGNEALRVMSIFLHRRRTRGPDAYQRPVVIEQRVASIANFRPASLERYSSDSSAWFHWTIWIAAHLRRRMPKKFDSTAPKAR